MIGFERIDYLDMAIASHITCITFASRWLMVMKRYRQGSGNYLENILVENGLNYAGIKFFEPRKKSSP